MTLTWREEMSAAKYEKLQQGLLALSFAWTQQEKLRWIARESGGEFWLVSKVKSLYLDMKPVPAALSKGCQMAVMFGRALTP